MSIIGCGAVALIYELNVPEIFHLSFFQQLFMQFKQKKVYSEKLSVSSFLLAMLYTKDYYFCVLAI